MTMARVVLKKQNGNVAAARAFARRQRNSARSEVLTQFWQDVEDVLGGSGREPARREKALLSS